MRTRHPIRAALSPLVLVCAAVLVTACGAPGIPDPTIVPAGAQPAQPGPYAVTTEPAFGAPGLKTFRPAPLDPFPDHDTLPVIVWGNGGCVPDAPLYAGFLTTLASHGFLVVTTTGAATASHRHESLEDLRAAIDWAGRENDRVESPLHGRIATQRIAVMGQSCGGFLAVALGADPRVGTIGVFNSGLRETGWRGWLADGGLSFAPSLPPKAPHPEALTHLHGPVLLINGGDTDQMKAQSRATFDTIGSLPVFYGSRHGAGHAATLFYPGGGEWANVASSWALWQLKQDAQAGKQFEGSHCGLCDSPGWDFASKHLEP